MVEYKTYVNETQDEDLKKCGELLKQHGAIQENNRYQITKHALNTLIGLILIRKEYLDISKTTGEKHGRRKNKNSEVS